MNRREFSKAIAAGSSLLFADGLIYDHGTAKGNWEDGTSKWCSPGRRVRVQLLKQIWEHEPKTEGGPFALGVLDVNTLAHEAAKHGWDFEASITEASEETNVVISNVMSLNEALRLRDRLIDDKQWDENQNIFPGPICRFVIHRCDT